MKMFTSNKLCGLKEVMLKIFCVYPVSATLSIYYHAVCKSYCFI